MKPSKHLDEPAGRMVNNHGHWEYQYDNEDWHVEDANPPVLVEPVPVVELRRRRDGWTAARQHIFLHTLANTGSVAHAAEAAGITPKSAYRLKNHAKGAAFAKAWDACMMRAANRLVAVAFERATSGTPRTVWRDGCIVAKTQDPSDKMLMFLLQNLLPALFAENADLKARSDLIAAIQGSFDEAMAAVADVNEDAALSDAADYRERPPFDFPA